MIKIKNPNNRILIYGYRTIIEALKSKNINILIVIINKIKIKKYNFLIKKIKNKKIPIKILNKDKIDKIIYKKKINNYQGIIAYIYLLKKYILNDIIKIKKKIIILILYNITDTKNIGSIIRTSVCLNVNFIIIQKNYYIFNPTIIKISSGAIFKIPICREKNIEQTIKFLIKQKIKIFSITEKGKNNSINYFNNLDYSIAIILGNEEKGIPNNILKLSNDTIKIPILKKKISSLNVSVACGIILYEINRKNKLN
ncbi:MAG: 23S rRNA (guanosine(2251)-2'-O)-methyltransferase RlmB [Candidatus Shikimatogenerans bostrichidophilus]|nr:MAG: 23S rRNA (guanosine(2251)-2'-O)-methyltransferase RlmB [Candidatus Shikimatogenerans bostrichidophilus]